MNPKEILFEDFKDKIDRKENVFLLDVRKKEDFDKNHLGGSTHLTILNASYPDMLDKNAGMEPKDAVQTALETSLKKVIPKNQPIYIVCNRGRSSLIVQEALEERGYDAYSIKGGMQAWSQFHQKKIVLDTDRLKIFQIIRPARGCLSYLITIKKEAILIDPSRHLDYYKKILDEQKLKLKSIFDTHAHADHISGGRALAEYYGADYFLHPYDGIHPMDLLPATFPFHFAEPQELYLGEISLKIFHIPGHTLGNLALLLDNKYLFCGDSIFLDSIARPDLGGHAESWTELHYNSIRKLLELPEEIQILPAHFSKDDQLNQQQIYGASLTELKQRNKGLQMALKPYEDFKKYILEHLPVFPPEYIDIKRINLGLLRVDELKANSYEAGQNICAVVKE